MNILFITARADIGGGPRHVYDLARTIKKNHNSINLSIASPITEPFGKRLESTADNFIPIPHRKFSLIIFFKLLLHCREKNITIVHSHGRGAGYYSRMMALFGIKVIHTFHGAHSESSLTGKLKVFIDKSLKLLTDQFICVSNDE